MSEPDLKFITRADARFIVAPGLRLAFRQEGERWTHAFSVGNGDQKLLTLVAATVEGDPDRDDPARVVSPTYQEVEPHLANGEVGALLTGSAIPHHFSAVVTARRDGAATLVEVDIADRCRLPVEVLAATYLVHLGSSDLLDAEADTDGDAGRIAWGGHALGQGRLEFSTRGGHVVTLAEAGRRATRVQVLARLSASTHTQRLFYSWRWTPSPQETKPWTS